MSITFCPVGLTSMISTSSGNEWPKLLRVTVTLSTAPVRPETGIVDGDGAAGRWSGITKPNEMVNHELDGRAKAKLVCLEEVRAMECLNVGTNGLAESAG